MTNSNLITSILLCSSLILFTSCATVFRGSKTAKSIQISGNPSAAKVYVDNKYIGQTPLSYEATKRKEMSVKIEKEGYKDLYTDIETKLNPLWTSISIVGNAILLELPTIIDYKNGSISDIKTDSISYDLTKLSATEAYDSSGNAIKSAELELDNKKEDIISPAIRIRTTSQELILKKNTAITVTTIDGKTYKSSITSIDEKFMVLKENNTRVYYSDIFKIRIFKNRRWFPIITSLTIVGPITWYFSGIVVKQNTSDCSKKLLEIKVINHFERREFGKTACQSK